MLSPSRVARILLTAFAVALCCSRAGAADEEVITNSIGMKLRLIPAGSFVMGSEEETSEMPTRKVTITKPFYIGVHEVTQAQYTKVMGANPSKFKGDNTPVDSVSWNDAQVFCKKLSAMDSKGSYRLPTEAEWEYACRAGTKTRFYWGDEYDRAYCWARRPPRLKAKEEPMPVGSFKPNAWGLYDMSGNVWEWCQDFRSPTYTGAKSVDPTGPLEGQDRVIRGGSWHFWMKSARSANRHNREPGRGEADTGFRVVYEPAK